MASIQCKGKEMLLEYFENRGVDAWSISDGSAFLFKGMGQQELESTLDMLIRVGSNSSYRLKIYEDIKSDKAIKKTTPEDGSLNFVLSDYSKGQGNGDSMSLDRRISLVQRKIEEKMAEKIGRIMDSEETEPEPETIGEILQNPDKVKEYLEVVGMVVNMFKGGTAPAMVGNVSRVSTGEPTVTKEYSKEQQARLIAAINELEKNDPNIIDHLEKLAEISNKNKPLFSTMLSMLNTM